MSSSRRWQVGRARTRAATRREGAPPRGVREERRVLAPRLPRAPERSGRRPRGSAVNTGQARGAYPTVARLLLDLFIEFGVVNLQKLLGMQRCDEITRGPRHTVPVAFPIGVACIFLLILETAVVGNDEKAEEMISAVHTNGISEGQMCSRLNFARRSWPRSRAVAGTRCAMPPPPCGGRAPSSCARSPRRVAPCSMQRRAFRCARTHCDA